MDRACAEQRERRGSKSLDNLMDLFCCGPPSELQTSAGAKHHDFSAMYHEMQAELDMLRHQMEAKAIEFAALREEKDAELAALRQEKDKELAALRQEKDTELAALRQELTRDRVQIRVVRANGEALATAMLQTSDTVLDLKRYLAKHHDVPVDSQELLAGGRRMNSDTARLRDIGLEQDTEDGAAIVQLVRIVPKPPRPRSPPRGNCE